MPDYFEAPFWRDFVPRLAQTTPAIFHLVTALASITEALQLNDETGGRDSQALAFALQQCNKSIPLLLPDTWQNTSIIRLTSCILLRSIGNCLPETSGFIYGFIGQRLLARSEIDLNPKSHGIASNNTIIKTLASAILNPHQVVASSLDPVSALRQAVLDNGPLDKVLPPNIPENLNSVSVMQDTLHDVLTWAMSQLTLDRVSKTLELDQTAQSRIEAVTNEWLTSASALKKSTTPDEACAAQFLRIHLAYAYIIIRATTFQTETDFDVLIPDFRDLVVQMRQSLSGSSPFWKGRHRAFELGLPPWRPWYLVAFYCRDPSLRGEAVELLKSSKFKVGPLDSILGGMWSELKRDLEHAGTQTVNSAADISEKNRVRLHKILWWSHESGAETIQAQFLRYPYDSENVALEAYEMSGSPSAYGRFRPCTPTEYPPLPHNKASGPTQEDEATAGTSIDHLSDEAAKIVPDYVFERTRVRFLNRLLKQYHVLGPGLNSVLTPRMDV